MPTTTYDNGVARCPHTGKVGWHTKAEARANYRPRKGDRRRWSAFRCGVCGLYHVGHR